MIYNINLCDSLWLKLVLHVQSGGCSPLPSCSAFSRTAFVWRRGDNGGILQGIPCGGKIGWMWGPHDINVTEVDILCHFWNWGQRVSAMFVPQGWAMLRGWRLNELIIIQSHPICLMHPRVYDMYRDKRQCKKRETEWTFTIMAIFWQCSGEIG
jgi:hypothetical protein